MAEDVIFLVPGHAPMQGRSTFAQGLSSLLQSQRIESSGEIQEMVITGEWAYCLTYLTVRMMPKTGGEAKLRAGHTLSIFNKQPDGTWLLTRDANLLTAPD